MIKDSITKNIMFHYKNFLESLIVTSASAEGLLDDMLQLYEELKSSDEFDDIFQKELGENITHIEKILDNIDNIINITRENITFQKLILPAETNDCKIYLFTDKEDFIEVEADLSIDWEEIRKNLKPKFKLIKND